MLDEFNQGEKFEYVFGAPNVKAQKGVQMEPGKKMVKNTLDTQWQNLINSAAKEKLIAGKWHFHDLKAKGVSDHEGLVSGHKPWKPRRFTSVKHRKSKERDEENEGTKKGHLRPFFYATIVKQ
ncbi:hypothetical protein [Endozoicomonas sp. ALB091]|uniref:hypothetical protein n=1 Tax=Endozoicomonas sp. ALB091 TaxID=3403073 RepID=UPI003BB75733